MFRADIAVGGEPLESVALRRAKCTLATDLPRLPGALRAAAVPGPSNLNDFILIA
jgi:hypothetical protein